MSRSVLLSAVVVGALAFLAMLAATLIWMTVPERIVYQESSPVQTSEFSVEVKQHGTSYFVTPAQKETLDRITHGTPIVWFSSLATLRIAFSLPPCAFHKLQSNQIIRCGFTA